MELQIHQLCKKYGEKVALDHFSFSFQCGIYGIIGANGAGKTTLMNLITDNVKRDSGEILWDGKDILTLGKKFLATVGYMPQQSGVYPEYSAREFLRYLAELKEIPRREAKKTDRGASGSRQLKGGRPQKAGRIFRRNEAAGAFGPGLAGRAEASDPGRAHRGP